MYNRIFTIRNKIKKYIKINFNELFSLQDQKDSLAVELEQLDQIELDLQEASKSTKKLIDKSIQNLISLKQQVSILSDVQDTLNVSQQTLTEEMERILQNQVRDEEVGGIPVDSEYIIFIIDNSGSMEQPWKLLLKEMQNILDIHPEIKGIQVMNHICIMPIGKINTNCPFSFFLATPEI